jgi:hypothetical protein
MDWETLIFEGMEARQTKDKAQWKLGDLALQVDTAYGGHTLETYAEQIGIEYNTLRQYRTVAAAYQNDERSSFLSWSHHLKIADRDDRLGWLKRAAEGKWSVRRMRAEIFQEEGLDSAQALNEAIDRLGGALRDLLEEVRRTGLDGLTTPELVELIDFAFEAQQWAAKHKIWAGWRMGKLLSQLELEQNAANQPAGHQE